MCIQTEILFYFIKLLPVLYETVKFPATFQQNCSKHNNPKMTRNVVFVDNVVDEYVLTIQFNSIMVFCTYSPYFDKLMKSNSEKLAFAPFNSVQRPFNDGRSFLRRLFYIQIFSYDDTIRVYYQLVR